MVTDSKAVSIRENNEYLLNYEYIRSKVHVNKSRTLDIRSCLSYATFAKMNTDFIWLIHGRDPCSVGETKSLNFEFHFIGPKGKKILFYLKQLCIKMIFLFQFIPMKIK